MQNASHIARSHHEKWDGTGFPDKLTAEHIPREAHLVAFAGFLLSTPAEQLPALLEKEAGVSFSPALVSLVLEKKDDVSALIESARLY